MNELSFSHAAQCTFEHDYETPCCTCPAQPPLGPHRLDCPRSIEAGRRLRELNERADDMGIGYGTVLG